MHEEQVQCLWLCDSFRGDSIFPEVAGPEVGYVEPVVAKELVGKDLAVGSLSQVAAELGARKTGSIVGQVDEMLGDFNIALPWGAAKLPCIGLVVRWGGPTDRCS